MKVGLLAMILASFGALVPVAAQAVAQSYQLDIPRQPLDAALKDLAQQTGLQIARFSDSPGNSGLVGPVIGNMPIADALKTLLAPNKLTYKVVNDHTIAVMTSNAAVATSSTEGSSGDKPAVQQNDANSKEGDKSAGEFRMAQVDQGSTSRHSGIESNPAVASDSTSDQLTEILVTAQKRSQSIQEVPSSITAISGDTILKQGLSQFSDYAELVPGLVQNSFGAPGQGLVILRGLSTGSSQTASTVAFIVDDIPFTANASGLESSLVTPDPDLTDVDRIEILKGPQGTLYGASALGGIIKIVSKQPNTDAFSADVRSDWSSVDHGGTGGGVHATVNIPLLTDVAAVRVSAFERTDPGFMQNVETDAGETNKAITSGGKIALKVQPTADLDITLSGLIQNSSTDSSAQVQTDSATLQPLYCKLCYAAVVGPGFETQYRLGGMVLNWTSAFGTLTNSLSYAKYVDSETTQNLGFGFLNAQFPVPSNTAAIATPTPLMEKLTEELRFATIRISNFEGLGGVYFTRENSGYDVALTDRVPPTLAPVAPPFDNLLTSNSANLYKEYAVFTNLTYYFLPMVDFTVGGRISHDHQSASTFGDGVLNGPAATTLFDSTENPVTYLATLRYRPTEALDAYLRFATGYRPGGPQLTTGPGITPSYLPDTTKNYEVGLKGRWLGGRLTANAALYDIRWNRIQLTQIVDGLSELGNGGMATSRGAELDVAFSPFRALTAQLSGSYDHAVINTSVPAVGAVAGDTLPFAPRFSMAALADYDFPIGGALGGNLGATYSYQGPKPTSFSGDMINPSFRLPGYATLNIRAGVDWTKYSAQLRVLNVFDKYAFTSSSVANLFPGQGVPAYSTPLTPRTLMFELNAKF